MTLVFLLLVLQPVPEDSLWKLFDQVAHPYLKYQELKEPSKEALVAMGGGAAKVLVGRLGTRNAREYHALEDILTEIGTEAIPHLVEALADTCGRAQRLALRILGKIGDPGPVQRILEFLDDTLWKNRARAVEALGRIGEPSTLGPILSMANDPVELVRKEVAHALSSFGSPEAQRALFRLLDDPSSSVRFTAYTSLSEDSSLGCDDVLKALKSARGFPRALCLRLLAGFPHEPLAKSALLSELRSPDWLLRVEGAESLKPFRLSFSERRQIALLLRHEENKLAVLALEDLLGTP